MSTMKVEFDSFTDRARRAEYIARRFGGLLEGAVLDVGCDTARLRALLPKVRYTGIDVGGTPDIVVNLEKTDKLPFPDGSFDAVVCSDVLEHLDNLHHVFGELARVSRRWIIISLPNNWANARLRVARGRGAISHYGLAPEPPVDRHKWFFNLEEAQQFVEGAAPRHNLVVRELHAMEKPRWQPLRWLRRATHSSQMRYLNRYAHTLWAVLEKTK